MKEILNHFLQYILNKVFSQHRLQMQSQNSRKVSSIFWKTLVLVEDEIDMWNSILSDTSLPTNCRRVMFHYSLM